jgi:hypothetical protein
VTTTTVYDEIAAAVVKAGLAQDASETADWRIRIGYIQDAPNRSICIYLSGGRPPEPGLPVDYPNIQIRVRGNPDDAQAVINQENSIFKLLHANFESTTVGIDVVYLYAVQSAPMSLGQDENRRPSYVRNYRLMKVRG